MFMKWIFLSLFILRGEREREREGERERDPSRFTLSVQSPMQG